MAVLVHLYVVYGCVSAIVADLNSYNKAQKTYTA